jgi:hypothetical protein
VELSDHVGPDTGVGPKQAPEVSSHPHRRGEQTEGTVHIRVEVVDVYDTIAAVVVRSAVYREYLHLVRTSAGWKIANALWQRV